MTKTVQQYCNFIDGEFVSSSSNRIDVFNPANGEMLAGIPETSIDDVDRAISAARKAQPEWSKIPAVERAAYLHKMAVAVRENKEFFADILVKEQGKVRQLAETEVEVTAGYFDYMAEWGRRIEGEIIESDRPNEHILLFRKPLGVVAGILPWNFPFFLVARKLAPALITGNTAVIKPSEETPINAFEFARCISHIGLPKGVFNLVGGSGETVGHHLSGSDQVDMISFTGSVLTGSRIMASAATNITKVNLELGGKAPAIVMNDADIDLAVRAIRDSRVINTGQVCNCVERVYVQNTVADEFLAKMIEAMSSTRYGDPGVDNDLDMGPLINGAALERMEGAVKTAINQGAELMLGGRRADMEHGFHYEPTVLGGCSNNMDIMRKEIFGPILPVQIFSDFEEAVALANDSDYGLTSSIYTSNLNTGMIASKMLRFGETYINRENFEAIQGFHAGVRKSGLGGADGKYGLYENMATHVVYIDF